MSEMSKIKSKNSWNKSDLIFLLANEIGVPRTRATQYMNIVLDSISDALVSGKKVTISDFGTFQVSERRAFAGQNPKTGAPIRVPVRKIPVFRAGKRLKTALNTPQLKECMLVDAKKVRVKFSRLMDESSALLTDPRSYEVLIDGKSMGLLKSVEIDARENTEVNKQQVQGVRSVIVSCSQQLRGTSLLVHFKQGLLDLYGAAVLTK